MRLLILTTLLTGLGCLAQEPAPATAAPPAITLPAGTKVPLRLTTPLGTKTARPGDTVRAEVIFPVTTANAVAIPAGTFAEGTVDQVTSRGPHAGFGMHFVKLVYSNGYTVPLSAATADTRAAVVGTGDPGAAAPAGAMAFSSTPTPPTPTVTAPSVGPSKGLVIGLSTGITAAVLIVGLAVGRRGGTVYLQAGWKFEMTLADALSLDAAKVAAAVAGSSPQ